MAVLTDLQWGRILALVWLDSRFKDEFEKNPTEAFETLKTTRKDEIRKEYGDSILDDLGIDDPDLSLSNFEVMSWPAVDFWSISGNDLDACIQGNLIIVPGDSPWFWNSQSGSALIATSETLTKEEWGQIYARIWMDYRLNEPHLDPNLREKYSPKQGYVEIFEKDPAAIVKKIVAEIKTKNWGKEIKFPAPGKDKLFVVQDLPAALANYVDKTIVQTGLPGNQPLIWEVNKC